MSAPDRIRLRLYVAGPSPRSTRTIESVRRLCEGPLAGACDLEIVDLYQQPGLAGRDGVVAAPTLLRLSPLPARRVAGDLTDAHRVLGTLGLADPGSVAAASLQVAQQQQQQDPAPGLGGPDVA
ncbi:MAG: circadian clock KaiB family protein [Methylobacteriaceae bacterium]|uniref:Circadian clock protein KaiB n=1 Tax=Methylorubrum suomiense TaxID=144191 RepID=A0ABQ4URG0_9HYPH|nr:MULTISPECIES: circadian clock KaiB family protein [Methylobacteriaceae]GJE74832.1 Circadian clock protein KaiB [Methylorubrum suomiense]